MQLHLREAREARGYTLRAFAALIQIHAGNWSEIERGIRHLGWDHLERCCHILQQPLCQLVTMDPRPDLALPEEPVHGT